MESSPPDQLSFHFSPLLLRAHPFFHTRTLLTHLQRPPFPFIFSIAVKYSSYTHFSLPPSSRQTHSSVATNKYLLFHTFPPPILFFLKNENLPRGKPCISRGKRRSEPSLSLSPGNPAKHIADREYRSPRRRRRRRFVASLFVARADARVVQDPLNKTAPWIFQSVRSKSSSTSFPRSLFSHRLDRTISSFFFSRTRDLAEKIV